MFTILVVSASLLLAACGGSTTTGGNSANPVAAPSPIVSSVTATLESDIILAAGTTKVSGTATRSDGTLQPVSSGWRSDTPAVATVTDTGEVTGVANGLATIYVVSGGRQGQALIRVVPDYRGQWAGPYTLTRCSQTTGLPTGFCGRFNPGPNSLWPGGFLVTQTGDTVAWGFRAGGNNFDTPIAVRIAADGTVTVARTLLNNSTWSPGMPLDFTETFSFRRNGTNLITAVGTGLRRFRLPGTNEEVAVQDLQFTSLLRQ